MSAALWVNFTHSAALYFCEMAQRGHFTPSQSHLKGPLGGWENGIYFNFSAGGFQVPSRAAGLGQ